MVSFRGQKKAWATPDRSPLGFNSKFPTSIPAPFICGVPPGLLPFSIAFEGPPSWHLFSMNITKAVQSWHCVLVSSKATCHLLKIVKIASDKIWVLP